MVSSPSHNRWRHVPLIAAFVIAGLALFSAPTYGCRSAHASDIFPSDYCFQTDIAITYGGAGTLTNQPVRVQLNADGLIDSSQMDPRAWDLKPIIGSLANEVHLTAQSLGSTTSAWWIVVPEISAGETRTTRIYSGSPEQRRDQGIFFTGGEYVVVSNHTDFDISDNLDVRFDMTVTDATPRTQIIVDKWSGAVGYRIQLQDDSGLKIRVRIDGGDCQIAWNSAWTSVKSSWRVEYVAAAGADTFIYRDGSLVGSCDLDEASIGNSGVDVGIGAIASTGTALLSDAEISNVEILEAGAVAGRWGFDAANMSETVSTNPYEGTISDYSGNGHTAAYTFDRDQSDFTYTVGGTQLVSGAAQLTIDSTPADVLGQINIGGSGVSTTGPFYTVFLSKWAEAAPVAVFGYVVALSLIGLLMAVLSYKLTRYIPIALVMFGIPFAVGVANGWVPPWFMILWVILALGGWFAQRYTETA